MSNRTVLYTGKTFTTGGREGRAHSSDNRLDIELSPPGSRGNGTNPEQLFAAGWSACFIGAMGHAAREIGVSLPADTSVAAEVDLVNSAEEGYFLQARLNANLPGLDPVLAQSIVDRAHQLCPYSKATRGNIQASVSAVSAAIA
ncbi:organic hydroperoxide resistance protein [Dyella acidiphila]|uniref:Organic hydroperoxide resistance protein n=1 Tax=Dyella acidiphila TaxID=2775866 RepID=A0ABR9GDZ3_9GAMM|nr:organic hydroperoxide resistance protein [Dyella acidiphila]MBE1162254.1 organic hydroperoxide resistance protein [Dyella acidiphila]